MFKRKLYNNGDIYEGSRFITTIYHQGHLGWLLGKSPSGRRKYLDFPETIEENYEKEKSKHRIVHEEKEDLGSMIEESLRDIDTARSDNMKALEETIKGISNK